MKFQWNLNAPTGRLRCPTNLCTESHGVAQQWSWDYSRHAHTLTQKRKTDRGGEGEKGFFKGLSSRIFLSPRSHLWILPLLVFICSSTSSLGQFWQYIRLKRHGPTLWQWHNWASVFWITFVETNGMCTLARGSPQKTQINLDGMLLQNSPQFLKLICSKYYGVALAMSRTH